MRLSIIRLITAAMVISLSLAATAADVTEARKLTTEQTEFFEAKIRPIFVEHCYECHSVEADEREAGLSLDSRWGWSTGGDSGPAVVPGKPEESLLIHAVRYQEDVVSAMPPDSKLSDEQIRLLEQWIADGAPDPRAKPAQTDSATIERFDIQKRFSEHWSWRPVRSPTPPAIKHPSWARSDLDRFILARLEEAGLKPAEEADRRTWIRRLTFDLIGLPPSREEVRSFLEDESPSAHETVVDRLLDSKHFGEKWARHWMDLVRYAETYGHEFDYPIHHASAYRDYLIRAFNADVPYDQLIREHIAGDLLAQPRRHPEEDFNESIIGTGFWFLHEATHAPTDVLGNESDIIANQLDVLGKTFLGLTVACARCHDHKFDAISTADYYALSAYIQASCRQEYPLDPGRRIETLTAEISKLHEAAEEAWKAADFGGDRLRPGRYFAAARDLIQRAIDETPEESRNADRLPQPAESSVSDLASQSGLDQARLQAWIKALVDTDLKAEPAQAIAWLAHSLGRPETVKRVQQKLAAEQRASEDFRARSHLIADFNGETLPAGWSTSGFAFQHHDGIVDSGRLGMNQAGTLRSPTFEITAKNLHLLMRSTENIEVKLVIDNYQMATFNGLLFKGTFLNGGAAKTAGRWQWKTLGADLRKYLGHKAYLQVFDRGGNAEVAIDEIWLSAGGPPRLSVDGSLAGLEATPAALDQRWEASLAQLRNNRQDSFLTALLSAKLVTLAELDEHASQKLSEADRLAKQLPGPRYVIAMAEGTPEEANIYIRGSHLNLGKPVPARNLEALGGRTGNRLDLANQIANPNNPLAARVMANRVWHHLTGRGIVPTVDDFGPQGKPASHPPLLDYLAADFQRDWSIKRLIKSIVMSSTYRQQSVANPDLDREHLAVADPTNALLHRMRVRRLPAESIRDAILANSGRLDPRQFGGSIATHRNEFMTGRGARGSGPLDGNGRRSVYLSVYRNFLSPFMLTFDMPSPFGPKGRRSTSNVPAQALTLMNDPFVISQARVWADRMSVKEQSSPDRIAEMVETAHGEPPTEQQRTKLLRFVERQAASYGGDEKRAWADLAHALWNMKAFYFLH